MTTHKHRPEHVAPSSKKQQRRKRALIAMALIAILVAGGAGVALGYFQSISDNLHKDITVDLDGALTHTNVTQEPFYLLLVGTDKSQDRDLGDELDGIYRSDSMILTHIDPIKKKAALVSLHRDTLMHLGDNGPQKLNAAYAIGGPSYAVKTVSKLAGVPISHYAEINFDGFRDIVDALGGVEVDVDRDINDPDAGGHLDAGKQVLNGEQALILARARHAYDDVEDGDISRARNQRAIMKAIVDKLLSSDMLTLARTIKTVSEYVSTDLTVQDIVALAQAMRGINTQTDISSEMEPTISVYIPQDGWYEYCDLPKWRALIARINDGAAPVATPEEEQDAEDITPSEADKLFVSIKNGVGISGLGAQAQADIEALGLRSEASNADSFDYKKTLVVYHDKSLTRTAQKILGALPIGELVYDEDGEYVFEGDFLVLIGADWQ